MKKIINLNTEISTALVQHVTCEKSLLTGETGFHWTHTGIEKT